MERDRQREGQRLRPGKTLTDKEGDRQRQRETNSMILQIGRQREILAKERNREKWRERQADRQTETERERHTDRQTK